MKPLFIDMSDNLNLSGKVRQKINAELGQLTIRNFPDDESSIVLNSNCQERTAIIMTELSRPNAKILPVLLLARILKERKAKQIILITPYLPYMRQDAQFNSGESQLARHFAELLTGHVDKVVTVEPHLHRIHQLSAIFTIPTATVHSTTSIASWINAHIENPVIIGPDSESSQWVSPVAEELELPYLVAEKVRKGDTDVSINIDGLERFKGYSPVVVDDIISTGFTMVGIGKLLKSQGFNNSVCIATHAIFADDAYIRLSNSCFNQVITTNTIPHTSNHIDVSEEISRAYIKLQSENVEY